MKQLKSTPIWKRLPRKWWFVAIVATLLIGIFAYAGWSIYAWSDYKTQYTSRYETLKHDIKMTFEMRNGTSDEKAKKMSALINIQMAAAGVEVYCDAYKGIHWQSFIGEVRTRVDDCHRLMKPAKTFSGDVEPVIAHLKGEEVLGRVLSKGGMNEKELEEATWPAYAEKWTAISVEVQKLMLTSSLKSTQKLAEEKAASIAVAWSALSAATAAKDRPKYEVALDQLQTAYGTLAVVSETSQKELQILVGRLGKSYSRLFS